MKSVYRMKNRKSAGKPGARRCFGVLIALILLIGAGVVLSIGLYRASSKLFPIREIIFSGNRHIADSELRTMAGVNIGDGLLAVSNKGMSKRLLQSSWIRAVSIRKAFPDRLMIRIHEATPFAILDRRGQAFLIDEKGRLLEKMNGDPVPFLPIITADPEKMPDAFAEAVRLAAVVKDKKIATERTRVEIVANGKDPEDLSLVVDSVVIKVGRGDYEQKLERLFALEAEIKKRMVTVDYVDLRFANRVVVKPINEVIR